MQQMARSQFSLEHFLPWVVLSLLLLYTAAEFFYAPYIGFQFAPSSGEVTAVLVQNPAGIDLQTGDILLQVGKVTWHAYLADMRQPLFVDVKVGHIIPIRIERGGNQQTIQWLLPPPTFREILGRVLNIWWLAYLFWLAGTATVLLIRPKDTRWRLLTAFYFLTALWLVSGNVSRWCIWESAIFFRMAVWLAVPVYLHLHWIFPYPLTPLPTRLWWGAYAVSGIMASLQWFQLLPSNAYLYGFMLAILGSLALLGAHFLYNPKERVQIRLLLAALVLAFVPSLGLSLAQALYALPWFGPAALLALPLIPIAYFYVTYRHHFGGLELRINRLLSLYVFLILLGTAVVILGSCAMLLPEFPGKPLMFSVLLSLLTTVLTVLGFASFQRWVEARWLGIPLPPTHLLETYASRITTSLQIADLAHLLKDEILPSLLVRQSALLQLDTERRTSAIYTEQVDSSQLPNRDEILVLLTELGTYRVSSSADSSGSCSAWVRLALPLRIGDRLIGLWLLGKHDPDDFYPQTEIAIFQALADGTAIALTHINQAEQLRALYQANIDRHELERTQLAYVLHDEVLHQLAVLSMHVEAIKTSPHFDAAYQVLTTRIRQLITGLRPAMMQYGLRAALEELLEDLAERTAGHVTIQLDLPETSIRYAAQVEQAAFRIVQQACENALRHAQAHSICVQGKLEPDHITLIVQDDGLGFPANMPLDLPTLLANKHFGLVGMHERAALIGAELQIDALPGQGVRVVMHWRAEAVAITHPQSAFFQAD